MVGSTELELAMSSRRSCLFFRLRIQTERAATAPQRQRPCWIDAKFYGLATCTSMCKTYRYRNNLIPSTLLRFVASLWLPRAAGRMLLTTSFPVFHILAANNEIKTGTAHQ